MIKISFPAVSRLLLALFALTATVSCLPGTMPFNSGGPNAAATGGGIGRRTAVPTMASTGLFFGSGRSSYYNRGYGYGSGYGSRSVCNVCGYNPCRCSGSSHRGHSSHGSSSSRFSSSSNRSTAAAEKNHDHSNHPHGHDTYRIAGGSLPSSKTKPSGYHSLDWYKSKGYDTSKLTLKNEHGQTKGSSSSSKSKSSSSKSRKKK